MTCSCPPSQNKPKDSALAASYANKSCQCAALAQAALNSFQLVYLGALSSAPVTSTVGALYFDTSSDTMFVWNGTSWQTADFNEFTAFFATGTTTARNLVTRTSEVFNVRDFGAVGDGVTDDRNAFQAAFDEANAAGGGVVYIPAGRYRKADTANNVWTIYSNTSLAGEGDQSVIFFDDKSTQVRSGNDMIITDPSGTGNIEFKNFKVEGTLLTELNMTNQKFCFTGNNINGLRFENITMVGLRAMATAFNQVKNGIFTGNRLEYIALDGLRATSSQNVIFSNNTFKAVTDDCIAAHAYNADSPRAGSFIITNNTIEASQGIKVLGAKELIISNNVMRRMLRTPIHIETTGAANIEGQTNSLSINITGNTISDTFGDRGTNSAIYCIYQNGRSKQALAQQPGVSTLPYDYNYLTNINNGATVRSGMFGFNITNNIISRTLGDTAQYSNFGYGQLFDRITTGFYSNPAVNSASQITHGIIFGSGINGLNISDNTISGTTFTGINLVNITTSNIIDFNNVTISRNTIIDVVGYGILCNTSGSGVGASNILITSNTFDIDPFYRNANHAANNTWTATSGAAGILNSFLIGLYVSDNVFKNCASTGLQGPPIIYPSGRNYIYADFTIGGPNDAGTNYGVRLIPAFKNNIVIPIFGDPTASNYGQIRNTIVKTSFTQPASGYYISGTFVENANPVVAGTLGSQYTISGWFRLTTGNAHVANTDWVECRALTGT